MKFRRLPAYIMLVALALTMIPKEVLSQFELEATVATDQASYQLRNAVEIYGNVTYLGQPVDEGLMGIQVRTPLNNIVARTIPTGTEHTGGWDVEIVSLYASDDGGNPESAFTRGDRAYFTVAVRNNKVIQQDFNTSTTSTVNPDRIFLTIWQLPSYNDASSNRV